MILYGKKNNKKRLSIILKLMILSFKEIIKYSKKINQKLLLKPKALWIKTFIINAETK